MAVEDANHTNPYMFGGRRFDIEIGLYYNRARYYNPFTGRFLQTDPIGYADGMNMYAYCRNNPLGLVDPLGTCFVYPGQMLDMFDSDNSSDSNDSNDLSWHLNRNLYNQAPETVEEARNSYWWIPDDPAGADNPHHWPDTFRGRPGGPYEGC